uniref:Uncharacterized protein n=1 Tax=Meloidogyne javanica TaxID=6303 RepID=A0A915LJ41_MELJA
MFYQHQQQNPQPTTLEASAYPSQYCQHQQPESQLNQQPIGPTEIVFPQLLTQASNIDSDILQQQSCSASNQIIQLETERNSCDQDLTGLTGRQNSTNATESTIGESAGINDNILPADQSIWVMRESYLKRRERDEQKRLEPDFSEQSVPICLAETEDAVKSVQYDDDETDGLLAMESAQESRNKHDVGTSGATDNSNGLASRKGSKKEVIIHEPAVLIEGVLFRARYLGSTQMSSDGRTTKSSRMAQAQEAAPEGEPQPSTEIDLFISTEKIMVLNTDLQDILMDHSLRSISYIADIGDLVVLMARRMPCQQEQSEKKAPRVVCHVFESEEANFIAQSIGQAFQVAYTEFLRANGIDDPNYLRDIDYQEVLNSQEMMAEELELLARKETQKDVVISKRAGEPMGIVIVESGWGSMLPTSVIANMAPGGPAARSNQLNIGDQNARSSTAVRLTIVSTPPVVEVRIRRPDTKYQLGFSVQNGIICSLLRGGIAERGGHRIIEINQTSVVAVTHERIVNMLATATGEIHMKTMPTSMFRLLTGQEIPNYI